MSTVLRAVAPLIPTLISLWLMHWTIREIEHLRADRRDPKQFPEKQD